jgi:ATPase subunit of ABC transporter with duplicated ATPase domains
MGALQDKIDALTGGSRPETERSADAAPSAGRRPIVGTLSGGEKRRWRSASLERPDLLLLDEPTNHLDAETVNWLEDQLREYPGTVIVVTHDRYFLDNITQWILELEGGQGLPWEGNYTSWLEQKLTALARAEKAGSARSRALDRERHGSR